MLKIRLRRMGAKKAPFYRIIVADSRAPRDGAFVEELGYYNPLTDPVELKVDAGACGALDQERRPAHRYRARPAQEERRIGMRKSAETWRSGTGCFVAAGDAVRFGRKEASIGRSVVKTWTNWSDLLQRALWMIRRLYRWRPSRMASIPSLSCTFAPGDMGKVIGKQGRIAQSHPHGRQGGIHP